MGTPRVAQLEERRKEGLEVPTIVTAACDRIMLLNPISIDRDLKLRGTTAVTNAPFFSHQSQRVTTTGMTTWVGKSSSEVRVEVSSVRKDPQGNDGACRVVCVVCACVCVMCAVSCVSCRVSLDWPC